MTLSSSLLSIFRPYAPRIIPFATVFFVIPFAAFLSALAGWVVWQSIAVAWSSPLYFQYGDTLQPFSHAMVSNLVPQQLYDISVHLSVPASDTNYALGNFMISVSLSTASNKTLAFVRRPAIVVPPRTPFFSSQNQVIDIAIPMLESYITGVSTILAGISLGRNDNWQTLGTGQVRELSIISASIRGNIVYHGLRGLVARFPLTFSLLSSAIFFIIFMSIIAICTIPIALRGLSDTQPSKEILPPDTPKPEPTPAHTRRRHSNEKLPVKTESESEEAKVLKSPESGSKNPRTGQLRRRRSRLLQDSSDSDS